MDEKKKIIGGGYFRPEEKPFIDKMSDLLLKAQTMYTPQLTDFLNLREQTILNNLINKYDDLYVNYFGGYNNAERVRGIIAPDYFVPKEADYELTMYEIRYPEKFANLHHGQILGSLTGSGIDRDRFGDIITDGENWQFFVFKSMGSYIEDQVKKIGPYKIHLTEEGFDELLLPKDESTDEKINVQSLRLDAIIATVYDLSRQSAKALVDHGKVQINWVVNKNASSFVTITDTLSVRGYGRIRINDIMGRTKNDKYILFVNIIKK
ncbi:S4 domain-containing protein [Companilactobacillus mindensis DSM 14500]|uniref:S4 domain-containing protein n=1 Tax=Companilactobacillus mindensis DSM 14500 TaxID=1423770 RepID=A0A0R1QRQ9_9LACO|nr:YlmH/Sll1252 family protein [Companilactobacillus mindensis]KRL45428.1 S4 domain-containing protein [Companilactobacillus mindensis DSM 14500]GEO77867.1 RNA-binding protein S4 [Companilactobacillus mindensis]